MSTLNYVYKRGMCNMLLNENRTYWTNRAEGYSKINKHELAGVQRMLWGNLIEANMPEHLKNVKNKKEINVLDIGTGPGFFSILLAERGYNVSAVDYTEQCLLKQKTMQVFSRMR